MAEVLLRRYVPAGVIVGSAGLLPGGMPCTEFARAVVGDLEDRVSRRLDTGLIDDASLILGMAREHVREVAARVPACFPRAFTLKELVRRAPAAGARSPGQPLTEWLEQVGAGRTPAALLGASPDDDVPDPIGGPIDAYRRTASELEALACEVARLVWGCGRPGS
jgi:protein-tyrosine phosphatase